MPIKIIIEKELEDWWGAEDLRSGLNNQELFYKYLIELVQQDIDALLDGAVWTVKEENT